MDRDTLLPFIYENISKQDMLLLIAGYELTRRSFDEVSIADAGIFLKDTEYCETLPEASAQILRNIKAYEEDDSCFDSILSDTDSSDEDYEDEDYEGDYEDYEEDYEDEDYDEDYEEVRKPLTTMDINRIKNEIFFRNLGL